MPLEPGCPTDHSLHCGRESYFLTARSRKDTPGRIGAVLRQSGGVHFADHLRSWTPDALAELLSARPDLLPASDEGFDALARKASTALSLGRCLVRADVAMLVVAQALAVGSPATAAEIDGLLGTNDVDAVTDALTRLAERGIVVIEETVARPVGALDDLMHRPLGLGPSFAELADQLPPEVFDGLAVRLGAGGARKRSATARAIARRLRSFQGLDLALEGAPADSRELLEALVEQRSPAVGLPVGYLYRRLPDDDPLAWMLNHGILVAVSEGLAELPREIVIGAQPQGMAPGATLRPVEARPVAGLSAAAVDAAAADQGAKVLEATESMLRLTAEGSISVLKSGGVGARELRRLGKVLDLDARDAGRLLELLLDARLIKLRSGILATTDLTDHWWRLSRGRRWLVLVRAWIAAPGFISTALSLDLDDRPIPALSGHETVAAAYAGRQIVIEVATSMPSGSAFDPARLTEAVVWRSPNLWGVGDPPPEELVAWTLEEAELLGLLAHNAPAPALTAVADGDEANLETLAVGMLGQDQDQIVLQGDLTAIALGPLAPAVAGRLGEMADRRPGSSVPMFRFSEASIRRAFDHGWTETEISEFLSAHALSGLPQPLSYLLADVERRYGTIKVMAANGVIVTIDEATAVEVASTKRAARLGLRLIAPTVLVGPAEPERLLEELRIEGFFPVFDDGVVRVRPGSTGDPQGDRDPDLTDGSGTGVGPGGLKPSHRRVVVTDDVAVGTTAADGDVAQPAIAGDGLPADWTGPVLADAALPGEVADAVAMLGDAHDAQVSVQPGEAGAPTEALRRLQLLWNRPAIVTHLCDGRLVTAHGVVVAVDDSLALLSDTGVEELPLDAVVSVEDPSR